MNSPATLANVDAYETVERTNFDRLVNFFNTTGNKVIEYYVEPKNNYSSNDGWILFLMPDGTQQKAMVEVKTRTNYSFNQYEDTPLTQRKLSGLRKKCTDAKGEFKKVLHAQFFDDGLIVNDITWMIPDDADITWRPIFVTPVHSDPNGVKRAEDKAWMDHPVGQSKGPRFIRVTAKRVDQTN